ncbi:MAG: hypothetical protein ACMG6S_10220 [Byssovorax sp.]
MIKRGAFVAMALLLCACTPKLEQAEVNEMLLKPSRGLLGGIEFGDSWEKIKADHDKRYTVRDEKMAEGSFQQLRRDLSDPGTNGYMITFQLDEQKNVKSYSAEIMGRKDNAVVVRQVLDDVIAHFDKKVGGGKCGKSPGGKGNSSNCRWSSKDGGPTVQVMYMEGNDPISGDIHIEINPPAKN